MAPIAIRPARRRAALALAATLAGCGTDGGGVDAGMDLAPPYDLLPITLGGAVADGGGFAPLVEGQDAELIPGAQGGFHVWMKFRAHNAPAGRARARRQAWRATDDKLVLRTHGVVDLGPPGPDGTWELPAPFPMFMCPSPIGIRVVDEPIRFEIVLEDDAGRPWGRGEVRLVPRCPVEEGALRDFCLRICVG